MYQGMSKTKKVGKGGIAPLARFSAFAVVAVIAGCAEIPADTEYDVATVTVEVIGGRADIFPGAEFSVPVGNDTLLYVDVKREPNTRIAGIWVDGGKQCCAEDGVVRDTWVSLIGVKGGVTVTVELAEIDTVTPVVEMVYPEAAPPEQIVASVPYCSFGVIEYRLNKAMANGYIKWWKIASADDWEDRDSLQTVWIPRDITKYTHNTGNGSYASPDGYLSEGLQRFDLKISPVAGKRVPLNQVAANAAYAFEIQFVDSLGNKSEKTSRTVWASNAAGGCP